jgi:hypothetical protein
MQERNSKTFLVNKDGRIEFFLFLPKSHMLTPTWYHLKDNKILLIKVTYNWMRFTRLLKP